MMALCDADKCDAVFGRAPDRLFQRKFGRLETKTVIRIDEAGGRLLVHDARHRIAARAARLQVIAKRGYARDAVRAQPLRIRGDQISGGDARGGIGSAACAQRIAGKRSQRIDRNHRHRKPALNRP